MEKSNEIRIRVYKATDNIQACERFAEGHANVLKSYDIKKVTSANTKWFFDPDVYIIMVESVCGSKIYGGARFHLKNQDYLLPIEEAIGKLDPKIIELINKDPGCKAAEMCGLWNLKEMKGTGLSILLTRVSVAKAAIFLAGKLKLDSIYILCAPWTIQMVQNVGFTPETSVGDNGKFMYPTPDLIATVCVVKDVYTLKTALKEERDDIFDLRKNPVQKKTENGPKGVIEVEYNLIMSHEESMQII